MLEGAWVTSVPGTTGPGCGGTNGSNTRFVGTQLEPVPRACGQVYVAIGHQVYGAIGHQVMISEAAR